MAAARKGDAGTSRSTSRARFEQFWATFRHAGGRGDKEAIADLTRFPFETRGTDDEDPVHMYSRSHFLELLDVLLAEKEELPNESVSMRDLVLRSERLSERDLTGVKPM